MPVESSLEEVRKVIVSLLVARAGYTSLPLLDHDYYEADGNRIPWHKFGFGSLLEFLKSMPDYFQFSIVNGVMCTRAITDKSKHVSSLVARQKKTPKYSIRNSARCDRPLYEPRLRYRPKIPADKLNDMLQYVKNYPNGVNINAILLMMQTQLPYIKLTTYDIQEQLRELGHQLYMDGDMIRPVIRGSSVPRRRNSGRFMYSLSAAEPPVDTSIPASSNVMYTVPEEYPETSISSSSNVMYTSPEQCPDTMLNADEDGFVRPNSAHCSKQPKTNERLISNLNECLSYEDMVSYYDHDDNQEAQYNNVNNAEYSIDLNMTENESDKLSNLISQRMQSRLQQLVQKYPDGIKCSELPDLYMKEFKMPLNYTELGFNSVCTFVSYLPDIFYLKRLDTNDDFIAYNADVQTSKEQDVAGNDDQRTFKNFTRETISKTKLMDISNSQFDMNNDNRSSPLDAVSNKFYIFFFLLIISNLFIKIVLHLPLKISYKVFSLTKYFLFILCLEILIINKINSNNS